MKRITPNRVALFILVMAVVAFVVYLPFRRAQERRAQAQHAAESRLAATEAAINAAAKRAAALQAQRAAAMEAAARAAQKQAAYQARYVNRGFRRQPGLKTVAIAAEFDSHQTDHVIANALADHLNSEDLTIFTSFFKPAFYAEGLFANIFAGSTDPVDKLELTNTLDALLLAQERVRYVTNGASLDNVITANARLEVAFLPFDVMRREQTWTYLADGAGFSQTEARSNADKRLVKQIATDSSLSLVSIPANSSPIYP